MIHTDERGCNPLGLSVKMFLNNLEDLKACYVIKQTYKQGLSAFKQERKPRLLSHENVSGLAVGHVNVCKGDKWITVIDLQKLGHVQKLTAITKN